MGNWRKLRNEKLYDLYSSTNINEEIKVKEDEMGKACGMNGQGMWHEWARHVA